MEYFIVDFSQISRRHLVSHKKCPGCLRITLTHTGSGADQDVANSSDCGGESSKMMLELLVWHLIPSEVCMRTAWQGHAAVALIFSVHPLHTEVFVCQWKTLRQPPCFESPRCHRAKGKSNSISSPDANEKCSTNKTDKLLVNMYVFVLNYF